MRVDWAEAHAGSTPFATTGWQFVDETTVLLDSQVAIEIPVNIRYG